MVDLPVDKCVGCGACEATCPINAIKIMPKGLLGRYPVVDRSICLQCSACNRICPVDNFKLLKPRKVYAAVSKNCKSLKRYASGGFASEVSKRFIYEGGVVYASIMATAFEARHIRISNETDVNLACGSKYVHSDLSSVFKPLKKDLIDGTKVLFIGTPCQVAAIKSYTLGKYNNLFCIDLICHGVPSQEMLAAYLKDELKKSDTDLSDATLLFRWKNAHKKEHQIEFGTKIIEKHNCRVVLNRKYPQSSYMAAFFAGISYRENCHNCKFASTNRVGDITIGDFWGLKKTALETSQGVSAVIVNSIKGEHLIESYTSNLLFEEHTLDEVTKHNANLNHPTRRDPYKSNFAESVQNEGFRTAVKKFVPSYNKENKLSYRIYLAIARQTYRLKALLGRY